jgi:hypothetical protein
MDLDPDAYPDPVIFVIDLQDANKNQLLKRKVSGSGSRAGSGTISLTSAADPDPGSGIGCLFDPWIRDPG